MGLLVICSSSSGLEGAVLDTVRPVGVLPFLWMEVSGMVRSAKVKVTGVGAGDSVGTSASAELLVCLAVELSGTSARCGVGPIGWSWLSGSRKVGLVCCLGLSGEEGGSRRELKIKEIDKGLLEYLCCLLKVKLPGLNSLQLVA
ncbi:hypothetical protein V6N11_049858 [Hibiscus sabdariffa]|uniref:Uncharacterized protein n=1 Tax=Hibiscus sabdariffa TaxID=183260 RepID=A0ABR2T877_9ROSI